MKFKLGDKVIHHVDGPGEVGGFGTSSTVKVLYPDGSAHFEYAGNLSFVTEPSTPTVETELFSLPVGTWTWAYVHSQQGKYLQRRWKVAKNPVWQDATPWDHVPDEQDEWRIKPVTPTLDECLQALHRIWEMNAHDPKSAEREVTGAILVRTDLLKGDDQ